MQSNSWEPTGWGSSSTTGLRASSPVPRVSAVSCRRVGVFVNATPAYLYNKVKELRLDIVQLHGHESPSLCAELRQYGLTVVKAFPVESEKDLELTVPYEHCCDYFLFDKRSPRSEVPDNLSPGTSWMLTRLPFLFCSAEVCRPTALQPCACFTIRDGQASTSTAASKPLPV